MKTVPCPCCNAPVIAPISIEALQYIHLAPAEEKILKVCREAYPRAASFDAMAIELWGLDPNGGPMAAHSSICVRVHRLNRKLKPLGWCIKKPEGHFGRMLQPIMPTLAEALAA